MIASNKTNITKSIYGIVGSMKFESRKRLGQNFLISEAVARAEAVHASGKAVLEIGPGKGMLTKELCRYAKKVIAVEKDQRLYAFLRSTLQMKNLELINADFFAVQWPAHVINSIDIVIANIPYNLSSRTISWLFTNNKSAVLCLQKEFVEHMTAPEGTRNYSRLSVMCALSFNIIEIMHVPRSSFNPVPKVDSTIVLIKPKKLRISADEYNIINLLMQHKKKTLRNAIIDSAPELGDTRRLQDYIAKNDCSERVFKMTPDEILEISRNLEALQKL